MLIAIIFIVVFILFMAFHAYSAKADAEKNKEIYKQRYRHNMPTKGKENI